MNAKYALDAMYAISSATAFLFMTELRYSVKKTVYIMLVFVSLALACFGILLNMGINESVIALLTLSIPSFIICLLVSKYRGYRFLFTFCSIDIAVIILMVTVRSSQLLVGENAPLVFTLSILGLAFLLGLTYKKRKEYLDIQKNLTTGWGNLATVSMLIYVMTYMIIGYPAPIAERIEYLPVWIIFSLTIVAIYIVMYHMIVNSIKIYNEHNERILLETKLELQRSQLELKDVYYKMAYIDSLTGLKNRAAFDKKKNTLLTSCKKDMFTCVSMDLNNLKVVNDTYGHTFGDELIKEFAKVMINTFGDYNDIYRVGGDEFVLIFEGENELFVKTLIHKLKEDIFNHNKISNIQLSVATGVAECKLGLCKDIKTIDNIINLADKSMYEDKRSIKGGIG